MTPLEKLLEDLDKASGPGCSPIWVHVYGHAGEGGVLATDHVMERMWGWTAPPECWAVGVVADAWARPLVPDGRGGLKMSTCDRGRQRARTRCLVGRDGEVVSRIRLDDGRVIDDRPDTGRTVEGLHRCLGLPTPPPDRPSSELVNLVWMAQILDAAAPPGRGRRKLSWAEVAALHPAVRALSEDGHQVVPEHADEVIAASSRAWTWSRLRHLTAAGGWLGELVPAELAEWMDDGMFCRWVLGDAVPIEDVVVAVRAALPVPVARQVQRCLDGPGSGTSAA